MRRAAVLAAAITVGSAPLDAHADLPPFGEALQARLAERFSTHTARFIDLEDPRVRVAVAPSFVWVRDLSLSLPGAPWMDETPFLEAFDLARTAWEQTGQPDVKALAVFTSFDVGPTTPFYVRLANDVEGIGLPIFDETPGSELDGLIWMGQIQALWREGPSYYREAFIHEVAHRWGVYVDVQHPRLDGDELRGRQDQHWSFFVDTDASPMDGNDWRADGADYVTWFVAPHEPRFSDLDLYLMGHRAPQSVGDFDAITSFATAEPDWVSVAKDTIPAHRLDVAVRLTAARAERVSVDDVIAAEGPRDPVVGPTRWPVGVVLLSSGFNGTADRAERARFAETLDELEATYARATGGAMTLRLETRDPGTAALGAPCADDAACNPALTDGCDPRGVCGATCSSASDCATDAACCDGWCAPASACPAVPDAGLVPDAADTGGPDAGPVATPDAGADVGREGSESCRAGPSPGSATGWGIVVAAWISARRRARSLDECRRSRPPTARA